MKTLRSCLLLAALLAGLLGVLGIAGAAPAPLERPGRPKVRLSFRADPEQVYSMEFSADGTKLLSCGTDGIAKVWNTATGKLIATVVDNGEPEKGRGKWGIHRAALRVCPIRG